MSVVAVRPQWDGWTYKAAANRQETITTQWLIQVDSRQDGPKQIVAEAQEPPVL